MPTELLDLLPPTARTALAALLGLMLLAAVAEGLWLQRRGAPPDWHAAAASLADALLRRGVEALGLSLATPLLAWVYAHRLGSISMDQAGAWGALFLGQELCYYALHRAGHRVGWFWASHCVHHTPRQLTLFAAFRLGWTGKLGGSGLFFAPLLWLGFPPSAVLGMVAANLLYQFWLHTAWRPPLPLQSGVAGRLAGAFGSVFNTPTHHRVHHASNPACLDCNYGGVLIVFDRLFGTLRAAPAGEPLRFGLTDGFDSHHPLHLGLHGWCVLWRELRQARSHKTRWAVLAGPPGRTDRGPWPP
ncbi:MAG TPA: sterol desaturase family protein [Burkholderiaceae bacterium]|nr:sterol desaturase family protein [Burkholderiaceae bacterium]